MGTALTPAACAQDSKAPEPGIRLHENKAAILGAELVVFFSLGTCSSRNSSFMSAQHGSVTSGIHSSWLGRGMEELAPESARV